MIAAAKTRRLDIFLNERVNDLRLAVGPKSICYSTPGEPEKCLPLNSIDSVHIHAQGDDALVEIDTPTGLDLSKSKLPKIEIGKVNGEMIMYGDTNVVRTCERSSNVLLIDGETPEAIKARRSQIEEFNTAHNPPKTILGEIKAAILRFVGRDMKLGVNSITDAISLVGGLFENKGLKRIFAEYLARRRHSEIGARTLREIQNAIEPGDILLRYQNGYPLDKYTVGTWQHAGACLDTPDRVIDSLSEGVSVRPLAKFAQADAVVVLRPEFSPVQRREFLNYLQLQVGKGYNFDFSSNTREHYCSGLIYHALVHCGLAGRHTGIVHPDELLKLPSLKVAWTNRPDLVNKVT